MMITKNLCSPKIASIAILLLFIVVLAGGIYYLSRPFNYSYFYVEQVGRDQKIVGVKEGKGEKITLIPSVNAVVGLENSTLKQISYIQEHKKNQPPRGEPAGYDRNMVLGE